MEGYPRGLEINSRDELNMGSLESIKMDDGETIPTIRCVLNAPTSAGIPSDLPTITNLDRSCWYTLTLDKVNEKVLTDRLNVTIRLGLDPTFTQQLSEKEQLQLWKEKHLFERLFDVEHSDDSSQSNKITHNSDDPEYVHSVHLDWYEGKEAKLRIRFNCVSSQFPFKANLKAPNAIFMLVIFIRSGNTLGEHAHSFCRLKLYWHGLKEAANHQANYRSMPEASDLRPSSEYTKLMPYDREKLRKILDYEQRLDDFAMDELNLKNTADVVSTSLSSDYEEIHHVDDDSYLQYFLDEPVEQFVRNIDPQTGAQFKHLFIDHKTSFLLKIKPNDESAPLDARQIVQTRYELYKGDNTFSQNEWDSKNSRNAKIPMIEIDYERSRLTANVLDIRMMKANKIEMLWLPNREKEEFVAFQVNANSKDFANPEFDSPHGMPFAFSSVSVLKQKNTQLGSASCNIFTNQPNFSAQMKEIWLKKHLNTVLQRQSGIILNEEPVSAASTPAPLTPQPTQTLEPREFNSVNNANQLLIAKYFPVIVLLLACFAFYIICFRPGQSVSYSTIESVIDSKINEYLLIDYSRMEQMIQAQLKQLPKAESIDYAKVNKIVQLKLDTELNKFDPEVEYLKIESIIDEKISKLPNVEQIRAVVKEMLDASIANFSQPTVDYQVLDQMLQRKFEDRFLVKAEEKFDSKLIDAIVKEKFDLQIENISFSNMELEKIEKNFEKKLEAAIRSLETKLQVQIKELSEQEPNINFEKFSKFIHEKFNDFIKIKELEILSDGQPSDEINQPANVEPTETNFELINKSENLLEYVLAVPTAAGISVGYPSLTNIDSDTWYDLVIKKLNESLNQDELLVAFALKMSPNSASSKVEQQLLHEWKLLHYNQRLFDLEYVPESANEEVNPVILDNTHDSDHLDSASFYWNKGNVAKLRIRFNAVHSQHPFRRSLASNLPDVTFFLHVKVSSISASCLIDATFCQIKLFWPGGAKQANHKANLKLHASHNDGLVRSSPITKFSVNYSKKLPEQTFPEEQAFLEKLSAVIKAKESTIAQWNRRYNCLHYILAHPVATFVNVTTLVNERVNGFFLENDSHFEIKLLLNTKILNELQNAILRTRFELLPVGRRFTEEELINWSPSFSMIEPSYSLSQLSEQVYDVRQIDVRSVEMFWMPRNERAAKQFQIAFRLCPHLAATNGNYREYVLKVTTFMTKNGTVHALDNAEVRIFLTESGKAAESRTNWLLKEANISSQSNYSVGSTVLKINTPLGVVQQGSILPSLSFDFNFSFGMPKLDFRALGWGLFWLFQLIALWGMRALMLLVIVSFVVNKYKEGIKARSITDNIFALLLVLAVIGALLLTFIYL